MAVHPFRAGEKCLVLKGHFLKGVDPPPIFKLIHYRLGLETRPSPSVNERVGAEGTTKPTALRGDVVELAMSLAPVVLLHRHEAVVDSGKGVDVTERTRALDARPPFGSMGGAGNAGNALTP